jgi:hypothetical protein
VAAWNALPTSIKEEYRRWAAASSLSARDLFIKGYIGGLYRYDKEIAMKPACCAYKTADQNNIPDSTYTKVLFDAVAFDIGSAFDTTNSKYVVPVTGIYLVTLSLLWKDPVANKAYDSWIYVNGSDVRAMRGTPSVVDYFTTALSVILYLTIGDEVEAYCAHHAGVNTPDIYAGNKPEWTHFDLTLLDPE